MRQFAATYHDFTIGQQPAAQLPWGHHMLLLDKVKDAQQRNFYMQKTIENGWSRVILSLQIKSGLYARQGGAITNFMATLPAPQSDLAQPGLRSCGARFAGQEQYHPLKGNCLIVDLP